MKNMLENIEEKGLAKITSEHSPFSTNVIGR